MNHLKKLAIAFEAKSTLAVFSNIIDAQEHALFKTGLAEGKLYPVFEVEIFPKSKYYKATVKSSNKDLDCMVLKRTNLKLTATLAPRKLSERIALEQYQPSAALVKR